MANNKCNIYTPNEDMVNSEIEFVLTNSADVTTDETNLSDFVILASYTVNEVNSDIVFNHPSHDIFVGGCHIAGGYGAHTSYIRDNLENISDMWDDNQSYIYSNIGNLYNTIENNKLTVSETNNIIEDNDNSVSTISINENNTLSINVYKYPKCIINSVSFNLYGNTDETVASSIINGYNSDSDNCCVTTGTVIKLSQIDCNLTCTENSTLYISLIKKDIDTNIETPIWSSEDENDPYPINADIDNSNILLNTINFKSNDYIIVNKKTAIKFKLKVKDNKGNIYEDYSKEIYFVYPIAYKTAENVNDYIVTEDFNTNNVAMLSSYDEINSENLPITLEHGTTASFGMIAIPEAWGKVNILYEKSHTSGNWQNMGGYNNGTVEYNQSPYDIYVSPHKYTGTTKWLVTKIYNTTE